MTFFGIKAKQPVDLYKSAGCFYGTFIFFSDKLVYNKKWFADILGFIIDGGTADAGIEEHFLSGRGRK